MTKVLLVAFILSVLTGCSNKELYEEGQFYQESKCIEEAVSDHQLINCLKVEKKPYEKYEKERKKAIKK